MRARLLAAMVAMAILTGACATVPSTAAAVVGGSAVTMTEFSRLVEARAMGLGMEGRDLAVAEQGLALGLLNDPTIRDVVSTAITLGELSQDDLRDLPDFVLDRLVEAERDQFGPAYEDTVAQLGVSVDQWEGIHRHAAQVLVNGILHFGQQQPAIIPLDRASYVQQVQNVTLSELVTVELTRQQFDALGLQLEEADIEFQRDVIVSSFDSVDEFDATRVQVGYPEMDDFDEFIVLHQLREQALLREDPDAVAAVRAAIEVEVQHRFGTWDELSGRVSPPASGA